MRIAQAGNRPRKKLTSVQDQAAANASISPMRNKICVALLVLLGFALGCSEFMPIGIESELATEFNMPLSDIGALVSLFALPYAIMTPVLALTTGRFKRYTLLVVYCIIYCLGNLVSAFAFNFPTLLGARIVMGCVCGALLAVGTTYIPELVGPKRMGMVISMVYGAFSVAMVVATSLGKICADTVGWHVAMYGTLAVAVIVSAAMIALLPREGETDVPATFKEQAGLLREPSVIFGLLVFVFGVGSIYVFYGFITPYLEQILGMDTMAASTTLMVYGGICLISNLLGGWFDGRFGMPSLLVIFPVIALVLLSITLTGSSMPWALIVIFALALVMYCFSIACITQFMRIARERHPKSITLATSLEPMSFNVGIAFGTMVGGFVVAGPGIAYSGAVGAVLAVVAWLMAIGMIHCLKKGR